MIVGCSKTPSTPMTHNPRPTTPSTLDFCAIFFSVHRNCHSSQPQPITHTILYADDVDYHASHIITTAYETDHHTQVLCTNHTSRDWLLTSGLWQLWCTDKKNLLADPRLLSQLGTCVYRYFTIARIRLRPTHVMIRQTHFRPITPVCVLFLNGTNCSKV